MIKTSQPIIGEQEFENVRNVLQSGQLVQGKFVKEFEDKFAKFIGTKYAIATNSGTSALHLALQTIGVKDKEVIIPAITFFATIEAVVHAGGIPVFADINSDTYNIDPNSVSKLITDKTRAVVPVHLYGLPCDMYGLYDVVPNNTIIIEDACQAHGAEFEDKKCGNLGEAGVFSFYATKHITTGEGGMITTNNQVMADTARMLRNHGMTGYNSHQEIGYNYRMSEISGAIGTVQVDRLQMFIHVREAIAHLYTKHLKEKKGFGVPIVPEYVTQHAWFWYPLRVFTTDLGMSIEELKTLLKEKDIEVRNRRNLCTEHPAVKPYHPKKCPIAESIAGNIIGLPIHPGMTLEEAIHVVNTIKNI